MPGRFVDRAKTRTVDLGECLCPGTPHESDSLAIRGELSSHEITRYTNAGTYEVADVAAEFILGWNLHGDDGKPLPVSAQALIDMMPESLTLIVNGLTESIKDSVVPVPNAPGAPSAATSQVSASQTPRTRKKR